MMNFGVKKPIYCVKYDFWDHLYVSTNLPKLPFGLSNPFTQAIGPFSHEKRHLLPITTAFISQCSSDQSFSRT